MTTNRQFNEAVAKLINDLNAPVFSAGGDGFYLEIEDRIVSIGYNNNRLNSEMVECWLKTNTPQAKKWQKIFSRLLGEINE